MSKYGRFFEKNVEGKYFCKNCLKVFTAQKDGGTSHLRQHLKAFHRDVFYVLITEENAKKQLAMAKTQQKRSLDSNYQIIGNNNEAKRHRPTDENWSAHEFFANEGDDSMNWSLDQNFPGLSEQIAGPSGLPAAPGFNVDVTVGSLLNEMDIFKEVKREESEGLPPEKPEIIHVPSSEVSKRRIMVRGRMSNIIAVNCHEQPIERVIVYNDRAEVKRSVVTELIAGDNVVHITNVPQSLVHDSVRVDGRGDCVIHEVRTKTLPALVSETDSPKVAAIRARLEAKKIEVHKLQDRVSILDKRIEALDKVVVNLGTGILPKDGQLDIAGGVLENISKFYGFYDTQSTAIRQELRDTKSVLQRAEEEQNKIQNELHNAEYEQNSRTQRVFAIVLESQAGGKVQLEVTYQVYQANWTPSYDFRVDTTGESPSIQVSYFGEINQTTGEDWTDVPLILSTLQPSLGGDIPDLGTMEVSIYRPPTPPPQPCPTMMGYGGGMNAYGAAPRMARMAKCADIVVESVSMDRAVCGVQAHALSTEFNIAKKTTVPSSNEATKVTVGIFELHPQLVHECVPSKNRSVFMTASAVNISSYPLVPGQAAVYVNNSFVTNTYQKSVSPNERFSCSLGVDTAVRVDYRPVKKYAEQTGVINKSSSIITEQVINVRNTKLTPVLLLVKEHIPRSTDEKIKIKVVHPSPIVNIDSEKTVSDVAAHPKEGYVLNLKNNLEWTVKLAGGAIQDLVLKYAVDHPKDEKLEFAEKY